jgi:hypothetical protein
LPGLEPSIIQPVAQRYVYFISVFPGVCVKRDITFEQSTKISESTLMDYYKERERKKFEIRTILLSLAPQLSLGLLHKIRLNFLEASQQFFTG